MIVDECDKYELPAITDTFSLIVSTADSWVISRIVSCREGGSGSLRGSGLNQPNSMLFFLPLSTYTLKILGLGRGCVGSEPPDPCWIHHCTV